MAPLRSAGRDGAPLRIALLAYRGNPYCGGQGVYVRHLARELAVLGHSVTVLAGQPYPELDEPSVLQRVPSLDLYRSPDPFRRPRLRELASSTDVIELATMWTGSFAEPRAFARRARDLLRARPGAFDIVHDNQCLGSALLGVIADGLPVVASIHHPVTIDRKLDIAHARTARQALSLRRWYGFAQMQARVARALPRVITVSKTAGADIERELGVDRSRIAVVPVGVDTARFRPRPQIARVPGRIMTTASADVPLKGLVYLLEALAKVRTERPDAHLIVVGEARSDSDAARALERFGLARSVTFLSGASDAALVDAYASATCAVVPSLYEGFSLPAVEAMSCEVPLVATTGGALPEVVGADGACARLVPPADAGALASAIGVVLGDEAQAARLAAAGRRRVLDHFTWERTAAGCAQVYRDALAASSC